MPQNSRFRVAQKAEWGPRYSGVRVIDQHPEPGHREDGLAQYLADHENANIGLQAFQKVDRFARVDAVHAVDRRAFVVTRELISQLLHQFAHLATIRGTLEQDPIESEQDFVENLRKPEATRTLP